MTNSWYYFDTDEIPELTFSGSVEAAQLEQDQWSVWCDASAKIGDATTENRTALGLVDWPEFLDEDGEPQYVDDAGIDWDRAITLPGDYDIAAAGVDVCHAHHLIRYWDNNDAVLFRYTDEQIPALREIFRELVAITWATVAEDE